VNEHSATGATASSSFLASTSSSFFSSAFSFFPRKPPKIEARLPRETERLLLLAAFFLLSSSAESLDADPVRAGTEAAASVAGASVSASLGVASMLFFGAELSLAAMAASAAGLPSVHVSHPAAGTSECNLFVRRDERKGTGYSLSFESCSM
jgi:hypothetical protein